jgi:hypothetical protein
MRFELLFHLGYPNSVSFLQKTGFVHITILSTMRSFSIFCSLAVLIPFVCTSCGDDRKLVEKREMQKVEISRLKADLALIDEMLKNLPADVSLNLAELKRLAATQAAEVTGLESELVRLEILKQAAKSEFDAYQTKFRIK